MIPKQSGIPLLLGFVLLLVLLQAQHQLSSSGIEVERLQLSDTYRTPAIHISPAAGRHSGVVAVLVHGHQCNKAMMAQLGRYLAAGGVDAFAIDLPGHGESQATFSPEKALAAAETAISEILERSSVRPENLVLIGHSFGAVALGPAVLRRDLLATVFLGPGKTDGLNRRLPNNALIITAEHDYDFIKRDAQAMYDMLTAGNNSVPGNVIGDFQNKDARLWEEIPDAAHVSLLFDPRVHQRVAEWIARASGGAILLHSAYSTGPAQRAALSALALSLALTALIAGLLKNAAPAGVEHPVTNWMRPAIAIIAALYFSVTVTQGWVALRFLRLEEGEILATLMAASGILGLAFLAPLGEKIACRLKPMDPVVAAILFLLLYVLALVTVDGKFYNLRIAVDDWRRLLTLGVTAALAVPFFLLQEELLRRLQGRSGRRFRKFVIFCAGVLMLTAMFCASLYFVGSRLYRFNPALAGVLIYCAMVSAILRESSQHTSAGVLFSSLVTGWIFAVGFFHY